METDSTYPARNGGKIWLTKTAHRWIPTEITKKKAEKKKKERKRDKRGTVGEGVAGSRGATNINNVAKLKMFTVRYVWYEGHERGSRVPRDWSRVSSSLPLTTGCFLWILLWYGVARRPSPFHGVPSRRTDHTRSVSIPLRIKSNPPSLPPSRPSLLARGPRPSGSPCAGTKIIVQECGQTFQPSEDLRSIPVTRFWIMHVRGWSRFEGVFEKGSGKNWIVNRERECLYWVFTIQFFRFFTESFWEIYQLMMMLENKQVIYRR